MAETPRGGLSQAVAIPTTVRGTRWTIIHCTGALDSLAGALETVRADRRRSMVNGLRNQLQRHADGHPLASGSFADEGLLPAELGKKPRSFKAYKRLPIRAYCWQSPNTPDTWFVSHYITKRKDKLDAADTARVGAHFTRIEIDGDPP